MEQKNMIDIILEEELSPKKIIRSFNDIEDKLAKTNNQYVILQTLKLLDTMFPKTKKEVWDIILNENYCDVESICKMLKQTCKTKEFILYYQLLNGDTGFYIIKIIKKAFENQKITQILTSLNTDTTLN